MATILELKQAQAAILGVTLADLTVNGLDFGLLAANAVRLQAEQLNDFEFQRKLLSLSVSTTTGGSLNNAVIYGTSTAATIKTLIDVGQLDDNNNMVPVEWTTQSESLERLRQELPMRRFRYPTDAQAEYYVGHRPRVTFSGDNVYISPKTETSESVTLVFEAYCYSDDWTANSGTVAVTEATGVTGVNTTYYRNGLYNGKPFYTNINPTAGAPITVYYMFHNGTQWIISANLGIQVNYHSLTSTSESPAGTYDAGGHGTFTGTPVAVAADADSTSDIWTTKGFNYILWASVVWLNHNDSAFGKKFVPRTEGNLAPPTQLADAALQALITNDSSKYEQFRTHGR